jgi:Uma2 family endonuclease
MITAEVKNQAAGISIPAGLSYEEFLEWLDEDVHAEWIDGEIIVMSPASTLHQDIADFLASIIRFYVEERRLGRVITSRIVMRPTQTLPAREPDVMFITTENLTRVRENSVEGPADLVVEVISPESRTRDTIDKFREYEAGGTPEYWIVDPYQQSVQFFQLDETGRYREAQAEAGVYRSRVIEGFWLRTAWLWAPPKMSAVFREWGLI